VRAGLVEEAGGAGRDEAACRVEPEDRRSRLVRGDQLALERDARRPDAPGETRLRRKAML
jgi:hypothetical protein